jgi:hypothetical protein
VVTALILVALVALGGGYLAARLSSPPQVATTAGNGELHAANGKNAVEKPAEKAANAASVRGRITEKTSTGESRVSAGSKVVAISGDAAAGSKLPTFGLQATASDTDFQAARAAVRKVGGDAAIVDETGSFELNLPKAGTYSLLVLSRFQTRDTKRPIEPALKQLLEAHFDRPESLPGKALYHLGRIRYRGSGTEIWDHAFDAE